MVLTELLTPETFLSLPRRGVMAPNTNGTLGLYSVSTHEFGKGTTKEWRVMDLGTGTSSFRLTDDEKVHDVNWLPGYHRTVIWLRSGEKGFTEVVVTEAGDAKSRGQSHRVGDVEAPVQGLKLKALGDGSIALAVVCLAGEQGGMYNEEAEENRQLSTARIYDDINVREVGRPSKCRCILY